MSAPGPLRALGLLARKPSAAALPQAPELNPAIRWRLLEMVYSDPRLLWFNLPMSMTIALIVSLRMHSVPAYVWGASGIALAVFRLFDFYSFRRRRAGSSLQALRCRYIVQACAVGAHWGLASLVLLLTEDSVARFWVISQQSAILTSAAARSHPVLPASVIPACLTLAPLCLTTLLSHELYLNFYSVPCLVYLLSIIAGTRVQYQQTLKFIVIDDSNKTLVTTLTAANGRLDEANQRLHAVANLDGLTGLANRRQFDASLAEEWQRAAERHSSLVLLMMDVDEFKLYNDHFGHLAGDDCLRRVAACIKGALHRPTDCAARYGGEEFVAILPDTDSFGGIDAAERIRAAVEGLAMPSARFGRVVTISIGIASVEAPEPSDDLASLVAAADAKLYQAKREGRNCVRGGGTARTDPAREGVSRTGQAKQSAD